jgi:hypothetical protein
MKKLVLILGLITMALSSCKKEETLCTSNCGTIVNDGIDNGCYWLEIQNECTGNNKVFCFDQNTWQNNYVGGSFCVTNEPSW